MTAFSGTFHEGPTPLPHAVTGNLDGAVDFGGITAARDLAFVGDEAGTGAITVAPHLARSASYAAGFDRELFEKILVIPRSKSLGFVLSDTQFDVEVWNAYRTAAHQLTAVDITGAGELGLTFPALPLTFWPFESFIFLADIPQDGSVEIDNLAVFTFPGVSGTDLHVQGSRLAVFSPQIDWSSGFSEHHAYRTSIIRAYSDMEQRMQLRTLSRPGAAYRVLTLTARDSVAMDALIYGRKSRVYGVPWWQDAQPPLSAISIGDTILAVDTDDRSFEDGGLLMIWSDQQTYEALTIDTVSAHEITLRTGTTRNWSLRPTLIVPMFRGRLLDTASLSRPGGAFSAIDLVFSGEVV